jgi:hypothetical protein
MKIDDLIGKPFQDGARGPDSFDCFGLFEELCRRRGITLPAEPNPEGVEAKNSAISVALGREWKKLSGPVPGCGVAFRIVPPFVTHIGMVLDCGTRFIHTREGVNVAIERLDSVAWRNRIAGFYSHV